MTDMKLAQNITVDYVNDELRIDGERFPFFVDVAGPTVAPHPQTGSSLYMVSIPVLAESFTIHGDPPVEVVPE